MTLRFHATQHCIPSAVGKGVAVSVKAHDRSQRRAKAWACYLVTLMLLAGLMMAGGLAEASSVEAPRLIVFSSYPSVSSDYQQVYAVGTEIQKAYGTSVRIISSDQTIGRMSMGRTGRAQIIEEGGGVYFAFEGLGEFADRSWGPQAISILYQPPSDVGVGPVTLASTGIETIADAKGRRVAHVIGYPIGNTALESYLAYANLTLDDVEQVEFSGYNDAIDGMARGRVDVVFGYGLSAIFEEVRSAHTIRWLELPHDDVEGWKRLQAVAPFTEPIVTDVAIGLEKGAAAQLTTYRHNNYIAYTDRLTEELGYFVTRALAELYPAYKDLHPELVWYTVEQSLPPFGAAPYHPGTVRYLKEAGIWNDEYEAHQQAMMKRQEVLAAAWQAALTEGAGLSDEEFEQLWLKRREEALQGL